MRRRKSFAATLTAGILFILVGCVLVVYLGEEVLGPAGASSAWPQVRGEIVATTVETATEDDVTYYYPKVVYTYFVGQNEYRAENISFDVPPRFNSADAASRAAERYPAGKPVEVYFDPDDPDIAVLAPGVLFRTYLMFVGGILFILAGIALLAGPVIVRWLAR